MLFGQKDLTQSPSVVEITVVAFSRALGINEQDYIPTSPQWQVLHSSFQVTKTTADTGYILPMILSPFDSGFLAICHVNGIHFPSTREAG